MKRLCVLLPLLLLTGCTERITRLPEFAMLHPTEEASQTETETITETTKRSANAVIPADAPQIMTEVTTDLVSARMLYALTLRDLLEHSILPSGSELEVKGEIEKNRFAVYDIDHDDREELILEITQADAEDCFTAVYDMDADGDLRREVRYSAELSFWSDGIVIASYTDAAETDGDFIPYAAAQYNKELDIYEEFAYAAVLDRAILEKQDMLDEYPEDADVSHSGKVYYVSDGEPMDVKEYEKWYASWHTDLVETEVPMQALTAENIEKLEE